MRVEIPAYTDRWMMGDRFGEVVKTVKKRSAVTGAMRDVAHVKLDKSGKVTKVLLDDCKILDTTALGVPEDTRKKIEDTLLDKYPGLKGRLIVC